VTASTKGSAGLAERYAVALFDLAEQDKALDAVADELRQLDGLIQGSHDLQRLIRSPVIARGDQSRAIDAVLEKAGASALVRRFVGVVAAQRRLFALPSMIAAFLRRIADRKGETTAEIVSARPLSKAQTASLLASLKRELGTEVALLSRVEPEILGGLVVKVGSRMVDSSLRTKLNRLSLAIRGVG
jgi:F-type H+-transporting ATPase subunit delta